MISIPTIFNGTEYRSRLEARWAAMLQLIGWPATYEPIDCDGYFPDFIVSGPRPLLIEIKPAVTQDEYRAPGAKMAAGLIGHWRHDVLILGVDPLPSIGYDDHNHPPAGLLGEYFSADDVADEPGIAGPGWDFDPGNWFRCRRCGEIGVYHSVQTFTGRPCGHYDGDGYLGSVDSRILQRYWASATNLVKWGGQ
jgi:hypothetical protein